MAKRIGQRDLGEDERRIRSAQRMFGYAYRLQDEPEPETLEAAVAAARDLLAQPVVTLGPPPDEDPFYVGTADWQRPPKAVRAFARQLVDAVEQAPEVAVLIGSTKV